MSNRQFLQFVEFPLHYHQNSAWSIPKEGDQDDLIHIKAMEGIDKDTHDATVYLTSSIKASMEEILLSKHS